MINEDLRRLHADLGLKTLNPYWAKAEIFLGLACVWASLRVVVWLSGPTELVASLGLFVLGGYLAMAGGRSHLYQSNNKLAAYLSRPKMDTV